MLLRVMRGVVGFVEDVELDLLGRPAEEERKRPVGRDARLPGLKEDISFQVIGLVEPGRELALGPRGHLGVDEEAGTVKKSTIEDEARITHLHTRNRPCSIALRRHTGHGITAFLAVFSVVAKNNLNV